MRAAEIDDVDERVRELTDGRGADLIVDTVSGEEAERDLGRLAYNGQLVTIVDVPPVSAAQMTALKYHSPTGTSAKPSSSRSP